MLIWIYYILKSVNRPKKLLKWYKKVAQNSQLSIVVGVFERLPIKHATSPVKTPVYVISKKWSTTLAGLSS